MTSGAKRYQVFVSSTYLDLVEERRAVIQSLLELECIPAGMEMFPAADEDQWTLIRDVIDSCDYYVVVVGGRYGSVSAEGVSFTEQEYDYAVAQGIPVLGFVHSNPDVIPAGKSDLDPEAREKLEAFREKVMTRMVKTYASPDELASVVSRGLVRAIRQYERPGWVRGDQAMTDAVRLEIAELRAAVAEGEKARTESHQADNSGIDESFAHGDEEVSLEFRVTDIMGHDQTVEIDFTWDELVDLLGPVMLDEAPEKSLRDSLSAAGWRHLLNIEDGGWERLRNPRTAVSDESWGRVLVQLRALGIISAGVKKRTVSDRAVYWRLTPAGDEYLVRLKAIPSCDAAGSVAG
jgi:hypothetical protein